MKKAGILLVVLAVGMIGLVLAKKNKTAPTFLGNSWIKILGEDKLKINGKMKYFPDGIISVFKNQKGEEVWSISNNTGSNLYKRNSNTLEKYSENIFLKSPSKNIFYNAVTSMTDTGDGINLLALTHRERWVSANDGKNFTASVGLGLIDKNGKVIEDWGEIISGVGALAPGNGRVTGAGQPSGLLVDEKGQKYLWIYYTGWFPKAKADQIYLARIQIDELKPNLDKIEYYTEKGWDLDQTESKPIFGPPTKDSNYASLPDVKKIKDGKMMASFETDKGVYMTRSTDGINWESPEMVVEYAKPLSEVWKNGGTTQSYPSWYVDEATGKLWFFMADEIGRGSSHHLICYEGMLKTTKMIAEK